VQNFIESKGGTKDFAISFVIVDEYLKLRFDADIGLLNNKEGFLYINAMEFFKVWFTHGELVIRGVYVHHPPPLMGYCEKLDQRKGRVRG
jgi:hypothetical protein